MSDFRRPQTHQTTGCIGSFLSVSSPSISTPLYECFSFVAQTKCGKQLFIFSCWQLFLDISDTISGKNRQSELGGHDIVLSKLVIIFLETQVENFNEISVVVCLSTILSPAFVSLLWNSFWYWMFFILPMDHYRFTHRNLR